MRPLREALRGMRAALAAHPGIFAGVTSAVLALNIAAPVAILSAARRPLDYFTINPWLRRLPEYLASDEATLGEKLAKLPDLALFWFSAGSTYGGAEWGFAVDVTDLGRIVLVSALFGLYFALWRSYRDFAAGGAPALRRGGVAGAVATLLGLSTGACSVTGCGAPLIPVLGLAFVGLESGTLQLLERSSRAVTIGLVGLLLMAVAYLGCQVSMRLALKAPGMPGGSRAAIPGSTGGLR